MNWNKIIAYLVIAAFVVAVVLMFFSETITGTIIVRGLFAFGGLIFAIRTLKRENEKERERKDHPQDTPGTHY